MYPEIEPYDHGILDVGDGHRVYWEVSGNPDGKPALVVHGGPGSGAGAWWRRYFDPARYRVVLVDQRNCGRSTPDAAEPIVDLSTNTTPHLIAGLRTTAPDAEHREVAAPRSILGCDARARVRRATPGGNLRDRAVQRHQYHPPGGRVDHAGHGPRVSRGVVALPQRRARERTGREPRARVQQAPARPGPSGARPGGQELVRLGGHPRPHASRLAT